MRITSDERKNAALSTPNSEAQRAHLKSARATTASPRLRTTTQLAFHSTPNTHFPRYQFTHPSPQPRATVNLIPQPTHSTTQHFTTTNPFPHQHGAHTPPPTPNRPTLQPHSNPSGQADSALQTEYTLKLPVVGSQHAESALLPGAAVQQRRSKDTPMAHQSRYLLGVLGKAVREPMLHLLCNVNQRCFGGMFREVVGLTDVHRAASAAQTVQ